jgi:signal transduction histidine kinase
MRGAQSCTVPGSAGLANQPQPVGDEARGHWVSADAAVIVGAASADHVSQFPGRMDAPLGAVARIVEDRTGTREREPRTCHGEFPGHIAALRAMERRIAREIHDRVGNNIRVAIRNLELCELDGSASVAVTQDRLVVARQVLEDALRSVRSLALDLRTLAPGRTVEDGLVGFIAEFGDGASTVDVRVSGDSACLTGRCADELFLILREALRNAFCRARARRVEVSLHVESDQVDATVHDDGRGFRVTVSIPLPTADKGEHG